MTNRLLFEAAAIPHRIQRVTRRLSSLSSPAMVRRRPGPRKPGVSRAAGDEQRAGAAAQYRLLHLVLPVRDAVHHRRDAFKVGVTYNNSSDPTASFAATQPYNFRFNNGVPNQITLLSTPSVVEFRNNDIGLYAQDKWTAGRLTLNYGVRFDFYQT